MWIRQWRLTCLSGWLADGWLVAGSDMDSDGLPDLLVSYQYFLLYFQVCVCHLDSVVSRLSSQPLYQPTHRRLACLPASCCC